MRVVMVGAGSIAQRQARACKEVAKINLVALCDVQPEPLHKLADEYSVSGRYTDLDALLANEGDIDIAIVATWGNLHAEVTCALARSGKVRAILCEKPISMNREEAETMFKVVEENGVLLAEAFKFRHHPLHLKAKELVSNGRLGKLSYIHSTFSIPLSSSFRGIGGNWRFDRKRGGGVLYDYGCYNVHHARFLFGAEPESVHAIGEQGEESGVDEQIAVNMAFPGGKSAQWWASYGDYGSQSVEVYGSEGVLRIDNPWNNEDKATTLLFRDMEGKRESYEFDPVFQFALQLGHMCDCLKTGAPHRIPPEDSIGQMHVIDSIYESLGSGEVVRV